MMPGSLASHKAKYVIGAEIGSRGLGAALIDEHGKIHANVQAIHLAEHAAATIHDFNLLIDQLFDRIELPRSEIAGIGVAFGGPVDTYRGTTIDSRRTPGFENYPIVGMVEDRFGIPVVVENDARAAAFGEYCFGAGRGAYIMTYLQLGIGVGGGIVMNGRLLHGKDMTSGELGHMQVTSDGPRCSCGKPGHLEAFVSETAILNAMRERIAFDDDASAGDWQEREGVTLRRIFSLRGQDEQATIVANSAIHMTGFALANLVTSLNCDTVILGGYAVELGSAYVAAVRSKIRQFAFDTAARNVHVAVSALGADAAIIGAGVLAFRQLRAQHD